MLTTLVQHFDLQRNWFIQYAIRVIKTGVTYYGCYNVTDEHENSLKGWPPLNNYLHVDNRLHFTAAPVILSHCSEAVPWVS